MGITRCGGWTSPTLPQNLSEPFLKRSIIVEEIKSSNWEQMGLLRNSILGGNGATYDLPENLP